MKKMLVVSLVLALALITAPAFAVQTFAGDSAKSKAEASAGAFSGGNATTFTSPEQLPFAMPIIPNPIPLIQGGRVGDVTAQVVEFAIAAKPYAKGMKVVKVLKVVKGSIFDRVRLEDIEIDLLSSYADVCNANSKVNPSNIAYLIQYKDSTMGAGIGGGGQVNASNLVNPVTGIAGGLAVLPGYTRSTADPAYFIKWFLVE